MQVHVYWNFNRGCWSVRSAQGAMRGRVIAYLDRVDLLDCRMVVQPAGLARARESGVKNVHAYIKGRWVDALGLESVTTTAITYNPFREGQFLWRESREPIDSARGCIFTLTPDKGPWCEAVACGVAALKESRLLDADPI